MHIASDGQYLYTCNGGKPELGQISTFTLDGMKMGSYDIELDMRSIMYNPADKKLYVNTYGKDVYRIDDLKESVYSKVFEFSGINEQSTPAISPNGKLIYFMDYGDLNVFDMKNGELKTTLSGLKCSDEAASGGAAVAVDKKHIYSWDADEQKVYVYDLKGEYQKTLKLEKGDYGFSLSIANGLLWVSEDGNYEEGTWYGYDVE
jgi:DNA-binding beta-propeller fold protein YncE